MAEAVAADLRRWGALNWNTSGLGSGPPGRLCPTFLGWLKVKASAAAAAGTPAQDEPATAAGLADDAPKVMFGMAAAGCELAAGARPKAV